MKIISGRFKGTNLHSFKNKHIRPTMSKVKEVLFNKIQFDIKDKKFLDLFSGTGALGLEALSRGASSIDFVEKHASSLKILKENLKLLNVEKLTNVFNKDVFRFLENKKIICDWDIVLIDPPFTEKLADAVMTKISVLKFSKTEAVIIIESSKHELIKDMYLAWKLKDQKDFGDKKLSFFSRLPN